MHGLVNTALLLRELQNFQMLWVTFLTLLKKKSNFGIFLLISCPNPKFLTAQFYDYGGGLSTISQQRLLIFCGLSAVYNSRFKNFSTEIEINRVNITYHFLLHKMSVPSVNINISNTILWKNFRHIFFLFGPKWHLPWFSWQTAQHLPGTLLMVPLHAVIFGQTSLEHSTDLFWKRFKLF